MSSDGDLIGAMCALGFSTYEARTYAGLLNSYGQTAYALSKETGVPQPKIYEALRRLEAREAAVLVDQNPLRYSATPPDELLDRLRTDFQRKVDAAESAATRALAKNPDASTAVPEIFTGLRGHSSVIGVARDLISSAEHKVYVSAWASELKALSTTLNGVGTTGVTCIALAFGKGKVSLPHAQLYRHASTLHSLYPHHQNRHFALVVDGQTVLWATSVDNAEWSGMTVEDRRLVGLVRSYIRHDIFVQKIYARLGPELIEMFGPGLELLSDVSTDMTMADWIAYDETGDTQLNTRAL